MKEKILGTAAWLMLAVGISTADSSCLLVPFMLMITGAVLLLRVCHK